MLKVFIQDLRSILKRDTIVFFEKEPVTEKRCTTCAFNPNTDQFKGFAPTVYGVFWAIKNMKVFMCHRGQSGAKDNKFDLSTLVLCNGFKAIILSNIQGCHGAMEKARNSIQEIVLEYK